MTRGLTDEEHAALSVERIAMARETLTAAFLAFRRGNGGAIEQEDPGAVVIEAKRNLTALVQSLHGQEAFERILESDSN